MIAKNLPRTHFAQHTLEENAFLCTGCAACAATCPVGSISMKPDEEGFLHPVIDLELCNNCDLCRTVCPVANVKKKQDTDDSGDEANLFPAVLGSMEFGR